MELANLENAIVRLKMKRYELKRNITRSHSSFIRILPPEIIATISGFANTDFTITGSLPTPILLSSVCSDWRRIVVGTPQLWSSITIDLPYISLTSADMASSRLLRLATFIGQWLARSGQLPLYISLCSRYDTIPDPLTQEGYRPIFKTLGQYSSRWHTLNISIPPALLPFLQPRCLPLLEQLHITSESNWRNPNHVITFPPTPCLNTVEIQPFMNSKFPPFSNIGIQWDTVTHVSAESITIYNCLALLRLIPRLVHCTFHKVIGKFEDPLLGSPSPVLSPLTYLSLHHNKSQVLNNIKLPSLKTLVLFNVYNVTINPLISFLKRSDCSLHTLSLPNWNTRKFDKLTQLLQSLSPNLTKLAISRSPSPIRETKNYLSILTQIYTSQSKVVGNDFLPHLEFFEYREEEPVSTLESFMLSNLPPNRNYSKPATSISLRSAYINMASTIYKPIPYDILFILRHLEEDGILTYT